MKKSELSSLWKRLIPQLPGFDFRDQLLFMRPIGQVSLIRAFSPYAKD